MRISTAVVVMCLFLGSGGYSQTSTTDARFEVASVKPSAKDFSGLFTRFPPNGDARITGATLRNLVSIAYGVRGYQVFGGPSWIDTERFDVDARASTLSISSDPSILRLEQRKISERLRNLLADRFRLTIRRETKELPVYVLMVSKSGFKLQESTDNKNSIRRGLGTIIGQSVALKMLAITLSNELERPVLDKTGLAGLYDFELKYTPARLSAQPPSSAPPDDPDRPSLFSALPEQLGLRLESTRGPVDVVIIDKVERLSKN